MRGFARPSPSEERWLAVASALGTRLTPAGIAARTGGWRGTGLLARIAMFFLGLLAVAMIGGILGFGGTTTLFFSGLIAAFAAESLARGKRLFASGVEEGLCLGGWLLLGAWLVSLFDSVPGLRMESMIVPVLIAAAGAAGLRLLNPFITTLATLAFIHWAGRELSRLPFVVDSVGAGMVTLVLGCAVAALALWLGGRTYQRPSHDRMLDWLVATLPLASHANSSVWLVLDAARSWPAGNGRLWTVLILGALGAAMLAAGLRRRRHAPLLGAMGCVVGIAIELRLAAGLPTELWLVGYGLLALAIGFALDRYLREPRHGFTSKAPSGRDGPLDLLRTAGAAVVTGSSTAAAPQPDAPVSGGGGRFGGGGASGSF